MTDILDNFDALSRDEQTAWTAWFNGGLQHVTQYESKPDGVFMGKAECEWVPFHGFWLDKVVRDLEWMTAEAKGEGVAKGMVGTPRFRKYRLWPTELGFKVRDAELERWQKRVAANQNRPASSDGDAKVPDERYPDTDHDEQEQK